MSTKDSSSTHGPYVCCEKDPIETFNLLLTNTRFRLWPYVATIVTVLLSAEFLSELCKAAEVCVLHLHVIWDNSVLSHFHMR